MATASFTKNILIKEPESINRFVCAITDEKPQPPVKKGLACEKSMRRGRKLLKQYLSR